MAMQHCPICWSDYRMTQNTCQWCEKRRNAAGMPTKDEGEASEHFGLSDSA